jgi:hypothetical protein
LTRRHRAWRRSCQCRQGHHPPPKSMARRGRMAPGAKERPTATRSTGAEMRLDGYAPPGSGRRP